MKLMKHLKNKNTVFKVDLIIHKLYPNVEYNECSISILENNDKDKFIKELFNINKLDKIDYKALLEYIFPDCKVIDCQYGRGDGHPDFKLIHNGEEFYIEIKWKKDMLRWEQFSWSKNKKRFYCIRVSEYSNCYYNNIEEARDKEMQKKVLLDMGLESSESKEEPGKKLKVDIYEPIIQTDI